MNLAYTAARFDRLVAARQTADSQLPESELISTRVSFLSPALRKQILLYDGGSPTITKTRPPVLTLPGSIITQTMSIRSCNAARIW